MSKTCEICNRGTQTGFNVSHAKNKTKRLQKINLKSKKVDGKKTKICTSCIKNLNKKSEK